MRHKQVKRNKCKIYLTNALREGDVATWHDHELLQLQVAAGVLAAVDDVAHRARQVELVLAGVAKEGQGKVLKQLLLSQLGTSFGQGERGGGDGVAAHHALQLGAVGLAESIKELRKK